MSAWDSLVSSTRALAKSITPEGLDASIDAAPEFVVAIVAPLLLAGLIGWAVYAIVNGWSKIRRGYDILRKALTGQAIRDRKPADAEQVADLGDDLKARQRETQTAIKNLDTRLEKVIANVSAQSGLPLPSVRRLVMEFEIDTTHLELDDITTLEILFIERAKEWREMRERFARPGNFEAWIGDVRRRAAAALDVGQPQDSEALLAAAATRINSELEDAKNLAHVAKRSAQLIAADRGDLSRARLRYQEAAAHYKSAMQLIDDWSDRLSWIVTLRYADCRAWSSFDPEGDDPAEDMGQMQEAAVADANSALEAARDRLSDAERNEFDALFHLERGRYQMHRARTRFLVRPRSRGIGVSESMWTDAMNQFSIGLRQLALCDDVEAWKVAFTELGEAIEFAFKIMPQYDLSDALLKPVLAHYQTSGNDAARAEIDHWLTGEAQNRAMSELAALSVARIEGVEGIEGLRSTLPGRNFGPGDRLWRAWITGKLIGVLHERELAMDH